MVQVVNVNFRLDKDVKKSMKKACEDMGLSMTVVFTIFAKKVGREKRIGNCKTQDVIDVDKS